MSRMAQPRSWRMVASKAVESTLAGEIDPAGGFVEDKEVGSPQQRPGQAARADTHPPESSEACRSRRCNAPTSVRLCVISSALNDCVKRQQTSNGERQRSINLHALRDIPNSRARNSLHQTRRRFQNPKQRACKGCLTGSIWPDERQDFAHGSPQGRHATALPGRQGAPTRREVQSGLGLVHQDRWLLIWKAATLTYPDDPFQRGSHQQWNSPKPWAPMIRLAAKHDKVAPKEEFRPCQPSLELVEEAERHITCLSVDEVKAVFQDDSVTLIDARDIREIWREGRIPGAYHMPRGMTEFWVDQTSPLRQRNFHVRKTSVLSSIATKDGAPRLQGKRPRMSGLRMWPICAAGSPLGQTQVTRAEAVERK